MSQRPDDGYEVAARIEARTSRRGRVVAVLAGVVLVGWLGATIGVRLSAPPGPSPSIGPSPAVADGLPIASASLPPNVEVVQPAAALGRIPVELNGLAWLDLRTGEPTPAVGPDLLQWAFALPDGEVLCVCIDRQAGLAGRSLHLYRFDRNGTNEWATTVGGWLPAGQPFVLSDAALAPGTGTVFVASLVKDGSRNDLRLQVFPIGNELPPLETRLAGVDLSSLGDLARVQLRLYVAPDAQRARVVLQALADDLSIVPGSTRTWDVAIRRSRLGSFQPVPALPIGAARATCDGAAWALPQTFVELCRSPELDADGNQELLVRIEPVSAAASTVDLGSVNRGDVVGWQVDGTSGVVYAWSAMAHRLDRVDVATGDLRLRAFGAGGMDLTALRAVAPDGTLPPAPRGPPTTWQPFSSADEPAVDPLVGSSDGRLLYATGFAFPTRPGTFATLDSTGVWAFDAESLALVAHWPAVAAYDALGLAPNGRYLVAVGNPGGDELDLFGNHGRELAVIDTTDGSVLAIQRQLVLRLGASPSFLPAAPPG